MIGLCDWWLQKYNAMFILRDVLISMYVLMRAPKTRRWKPPWSMQLDAAAAKFAAASAVFVKPDAPASSHDAPSLWI